LIPDLRESYRPEVSLLFPEVVGDQRSLETGFVCLDSIELSSHAALFFFPPSVDSHGQSASEDSINVFLAAPLT